MNKKELVENVSSKTGVSKANASSVVNAVFDCISEELQKGESVQIIGFGTFYAKTKERKEYRNNLTGKIQISEEKKIARFRPSGQLSKNIN